MEIMLFIANETIFVLHFFTLYAPLQYTCHNFKNKSVIRICNITLTQEIKQEILILNICLHDFYCFKSYGAFL